MPKRSSITPRLDLNQIAARVVEEATESDHSCTPFLYAMPGWAGMADTSNSADSLFSHIDHDLVSGQRLREMHK